MSTKNSFFFLFFFFHKCHFEAIFILMQMINTVGQVKVFSLHLNICSKINVLFVLVTIY